MENNEWVLKLIVTIPLLYIATSILQVSWDNVQQLQILLTASFLKVSQEYMCVLEELPENKIENNQTNR
jgi:hypothetical protein